MLAGASGGDVGDGESEGVLAGMAAELDGPAATSAVDDEGGGEVPALLRGQVYRSVLDLPSRYRPGRASRRERRYRLRVRGCEDAIFVCDPRRCRVWPSDHEVVDTEIRTDAATWLAIQAGTTTGLDAFLAGRLEISGDLNEALRLETLFSLPEHTPGSVRQGELRHRIVGRTRISTFEVGPVDAPVVVCLHGLGATKTSMLPVIAGFATDHRVIALDHPGHGGSAAPLGARYDPGWFAQIVHGLLELLEVPRAVLIGNSLGGRIAVETALRFPSVVRGVGLLCPAVAFEELALVRNLIGLHRGDQLVGLAPWPVTAQMIDGLLASLFADRRRVPQANLDAARDEVLRVLRSRQHRMAIIAAGRRLALERPGRYWERLGDLDVPSLWLFGRHDTLVPARYARDVRARLPLAEVETWDDSGHVPQFEHPARTNERLRSFVGALPR